MLKNKWWLIVSLIFLFVLLGCSTKQKLKQCETDKAECNSLLSTEKSNYQICSTNLGSCNSKLDSCTTSNTQLQNNYNSLSNQYNTTTTNLNNCQNERDKLIFQIKTSQVASWILVVEMLLGGLAWIFIGKAIDDYNIKRIFAWFLGVLFLTTLIVLSLIYGVWTG